MKKRYLQDSLISDALGDKKIAFLSGARQVGKTTLSHDLSLTLNDKKNEMIPTYFSWDDPEFKKIWAHNCKALVENSPHKVLIFDEIHKDRLWKNKLKGLYDLYKNDKLFLVTGSARLDFFRKSGDSLQGRYYPYRLHPFTFGEKDFLKLPPTESWENASHANSISDFTIDDLMNLSGFPDPLLGASLNKANRWKKLYLERMVREDIRDLQQIKDINNLELLTLLLQTRAGSQLSYQALRENLHCSFDTVARWIDILESVYYCYRIRPYSQKVKNSLKKEPKLYLTNWAYVDNEGSRFENLIAGHLIKNIHAWNDTAQGEFELFYIRDKQKREVDFFVTQNKKPYLLLEVKSNQSTPTNSLIHFSNTLKPKFTIQLVRNKKDEKKPSLIYPHIRVMTVEKFLSVLN
jgi:predicted AAA+ superfamily ATPase